MRVQPQLFIGHVMHRRLRPAENAFAYPVFYLQLPLRALGAASCGIFSVESGNLLSFYSKDHGPRDGSPLLPWIEAILQRHELTCDGEIVLQTFPRVCGYVFNPVSFWYCHNRAGELLAVLAEVSNTFGGRHAYLLCNDSRSPLVDGQELRADKSFHVSPFCTVEGGYRFRFRRGHGRNIVYIDYDDRDGTVLHTAIAGKARGWSASALRGAFLRMPFLTAGVMLRIHWQALKLWLKGVPFHGAHPPSLPHPEKTK